MYRIKARKLKKKKRMVMDETISTTQRSLPTAHPPTPANLALAGDTDGIRNFAPNPKTRGGLGAPLRVQDRDAIAD